MPLSVSLPPTFRERLTAADGPLIGLWTCAGSPITAEIIAGSGCDWVLLDAEHSPNGLESVLAQLYAMSAYPVAPVVRLPIGDPVLIKQYLDLGAQNLLIPMVDSAAQAESLVAAVRYPRTGIRGVGSALARSARWNRVDDYLRRADETVSLTVQIESSSAIDAVEAIVRVPGVDQIFIGPSDLAASMGHLGQQQHPEVVAAVLHAIAAARSAGVPAGVNAFVQADAQRYLDAGAAFVAVGADVAMLARQSEALVAAFRAEASHPAGSSPRASY